MNDWTAILSVFFSIFDHSAGEDDRLFADDGTGDGGVDGDADESAVVDTNDVD